MAGLTEGRAHAVALAVDDASHLCEVTVAAGDVVDGGGLHQQGVVGAQYPLDALLDGLDQRGARLAAHEGPHLLKRGHLGLLMGEPGAALWRRGFVSSLLY